MPSTTANDFIYFDALCPDASIGVCDVTTEFVANFGLGQKPHQERITIDVSIAVVDESGGAAGRSRARRIWGYVTKAIHNYKSAVTHAMGLYQSEGSAWVEQPRPELQLLTARFHIDALLGNE